MRFIRFEIRSEEKLEMIRKTFTSKGFDDFSEKNTADFENRTPLYIPLHRVFIKSSGEKYKGYICIN